MTIEQQNIEAAASLITKDEIRVLFEGERRKMGAGHRALWNDSIRQAYRQMRLEQA